MAFLGHPWRQVTVSEIERGQRSVSVPELLGMALALGVNLTQLLDPRGPARDPRARHVALAKAGSAPDLLIEPDDLQALICSHKTYAEAEWRMVGRSSVGLDVEFVDVRPDLSDVGPEAEDEEARP